MGGRVCSGSMVVMVDMCALLVVGLIAGVLAFAGKNGCSMMIDDRDPSVLSRGMIAYSVGEVQTENSFFVPSKRTFDGETT